MSRRLHALAIADFRERVRRPAYLVILAGAVGLGYLAVPAADAQWVIVDVGGYRGRYTSGYVGMVTAFAAALWLLLAGFYLARHDHPGRAGRRGRTAHRHPAVPAQLSDRQVPQQPAGAGLDGGGGRRHG